MVSLVAECEAGTFFNETSAACELCPRHRYQDKTGQLYCEFCKVNFKTKEKGAKQESDCKGKIEETGYKTIICIQVLVRVDNLFLNCDQG